ncbi:MAG: hypothetical protein ABIN96_17160 [Rubrivivax sp.]
MKTTRGPVALASMRPALAAALSFMLAFAQTALLTVALPQSAAAETLTASPEGVPLSLVAAVARAADGDTIELLSGTYTGTLLLEQRRLTLRGPVEGKPAVVLGNPKPGPISALWTVRGGDITVERIEFRGARAGNGGGAGLRHEGGRLVVRNSVFFDNEHGLLSTNEPTAELQIEACVFGLAPKVVGGLYHLLNVGRIGKLSITGTRFQQGFEGHLIKSRARVTFIGYNFIHDGQRGGASYEIEIAGGGDATVIGNVIGQGAESRNPVVLAYGTEGGDWPLNRLRVSHNTFVNYAWTPAWFLRVFRDRLKSPTEVLAVNNLLVGPGVFWFGASGTFEGNRHAFRRMLVDAETYAFELPVGSVWRHSGVDPHHFHGLDLAPTAEFQWPVGTRPLQPGRTQWSPGAYQR